MGGNGISVMRSCSRKNWALLAIVAALSGALFGAGARAGDGGIEAGRAIALNGSRPEHAGCAACHMENGAGQPEVGIPRLAGSSASYLAEQLSYFATGRRRNTAMTPYARMLTARQRQEVADFYASLSVPRPVDPEDAAPAILARGKMLVEYGIPDAAMPSCSQCHGTTGLGVGVFSPPLAGQSASYIVEQLQDWHAGHMRDPKGKFMRAEARPMSRADMEAVAAYLSSLPMDAARAGKDARKDGGKR